MNRPLFKRFFPQALSWAAVILVCSAVALAQDSGTASAPQAGQRTDGQIEMDVVHALDASKALKNDLITAATIQGEVTLSGTVSSAASSELAESIAGHVAGVTKVNNSLTVGNPQAAAAGDPGTQQMADSQPDDSAAPPAPDGAPSAAGPDQPVGPYPPAPPRPQYAQGPPPQYAAPQPPPAPRYETPRAR